MRLGYVAVSEGEYATLELTTEGMAVLDDARAGHADETDGRCPRPEARRLRAGDIACDEILFERLRALRKRLADERGVPAYIIFGDTTLRAMARAYPEARRRWTASPASAKRSAPNSARPSPQRSPPTCGRIPG